MNTAAQYIRQSLFTVLFISGLLLTGCNKKVESYDYMVAQQLFQKSARMIEVYIDSISLAPDSAAIKSISQNFNIKLTALNYEFPPDTDLRLNEEENDSLIRMHIRFNEAKKKRIYYLAHGGSVGDTLAIPYRTAATNPVQASVPKEKPAIKTTTEASDTTRAK